MGDNQQFQLEEERPPAGAAAQDVQDDKNRQDSQGTARSFLPCCSKDDNSG